MSHWLGRGLYLVGTAASQRRELRTHMFPATNSHMCVHMRRVRVNMDGRGWGLRTFRSGAPIPSPGLLAGPLFCELLRCFFFPTLVVSVDFWGLSFSGLLSFNVLWFSAPPVSSP